MIRNHSRHGSRFPITLGGSSDPYWANVSMLLHGDGTNAAQNNTFLDGSTNNFTVTRNGNTTQGSFNPFTPVYPYAVATNGGSGYFDGTGDYLSVPNNAAFSFGTGDFTVEMWVYTSNLAANQTLLDTRIADTASAYGFFVNNTGKPYWYDASGIQVSSTALTSNTWTHVAAVRTSGVLKIFQAGIQVYSAANTNVQTPLGSFVVGRNIAGTILYTGYISNLRVVNGTAIYTTTFTPPTAPLTAVTNTALLLGFTNGAIYDNAELNNLETAGNAQINTTTFKYGTGSVAFDGTGDYLTSPNVAALNFGTADFTIEMWVNPTSFGANGGFLYAKVDTTLSSANNGWLAYITPTGAVFFGYGTSSALYYLQTSASVTTGSWQHIALVRQGAVVTVYRNGTSIGTATLADAASHDKTTPLYIGRYYTTTTIDYNGYIDEYRITNGIARYTTAFTPPTAAFPNK